MRFTTDEIARATDAEVHGPPTETDGASQDSRSISTGQLFVPLVAERDGHDFIDSALASGAAAYLTHRPPVGGTAIEVADTTRAMRSLAVHARSRISGPVIGITGSVGKTSTKDLLVATLSQKLRAHASARSFNNEIGVPLTLLNTPDVADVAVIEMGARGIGHVADLCAIAAPTVGVITTVVAAHTGEFGSVGAIAVAKGELVESLPADGLAVLNGDVELALDMRSRTRADVLTFGHDDACDVRITGVELDDELRARITLETPWGPIVADPTTRGAHMATNVAAAACTALWLGLSREEVSAGLAAATLSPWRMDVGLAPSGATIINDTYNANPTSMRGALDSLGALRHTRKIAVLGYMAELGEGERADHLAIADYARQIGAEVLTVGTDLYGVDPVDDPVAAIGRVDGDVAVLVKASRSAGLEVVAEALLV